MKTFGNKYHLSINWKVLLISSHRMERENAGQPVGGNRLPVERVRMPSVIEQFQAARGRVARDRQSDGRRDRAFSLLEGKIEPFACHDRNSKSYPKCYLPRPPYRARESLNKQPNILEIEFTCSFLTVALITTFSSLVNVQRSVSSCCARRRE